MSLHSGVESAASGTSVYDDTSSVRNAGYGLFTAKDVNAGEEIFRSEPLVNCVEHSSGNRVGDYCYIEAHTKENTRASTIPIQ